MESFAGIIQRGDGRGRGLGFPTANLPLTSTVVPGIYTAWAYLNNEQTARPAVVHIGPRPTFPDATPTIEVHLLNFADRDLYNEHLRVELLDKIRDITAFSDVDALVAAIAHDCQTALAILRTKYHATRV